MFAAENETQFTACACIATFTARLGGYAINAIGTGIPSNEAAATPVASTTVPSAPRALTAVAASGKVTLTWSTPSWNGGSAVTGYNVYKATVSGGQTATPVNATPLAPGVHTYDVIGSKTKRMASAISR